MARPKQTAWKPSEGTALENPLLQIPCEDAGLADNSQEDSEADDSQEHSDAGPADDSQEDNSQEDSDVEPADSSQFDSEYEGDSQCEALRQARQENSDAGPADKYEGDNQYEALRHARIQANRKVLQELGVQNAAAELWAAKQKPTAGTGGGKRRREQQPDISPRRSSPPRRSARQKGLAAEEAGELPHELKPLSCHYIRDSAKERLPPPCASTDYDRLNDYRIASMSEKALLTRARKITNVAKLRSFVQALQRIGTMPHVTAAAQAAMEELS